MDAFRTFARHNGFQGSVGPISGILENMPLLQRLPVDEFQLAAFCQRCKITKLGQSRFKIFTAFAGYTLPEVGSIVLSSTSGSDPLRVGVDRLSKSFASTR